MFTNQLDPLTGFLTTLAAVALVILITLWKGRRMAQRNNASAKKPPLPGKR